MDSPKLKRPMNRSLQDPGSNSSGITVKFGLLKEFVIVYPASEAWQGMLLEYAPRRNTLRDGLWRLQGASCCGGKGRVCPTWLCQDIGRFLILAASYLLCGRDPEWEPVGTLISGRSGWG